MIIPWGIVISLGVLGLAYLIKHFAAEVVEEENSFLGLIILFIIIYIGAAIAVGALNPVQLVRDNLPLSSGSADETLSAI